MTLIKYCGGEGKRVRIEEIMERIQGKKNWTRDLKRQRKIIFKILNLKETVQF